MIKMEKITTAGWEASVRGMRNPLNSWDKIDSSFNKGLQIGDNDFDLMTRLYSAGPEHRKYLRFIDIWMDVTAPLYWWKEADTYHFMDMNSCSTMHTITKKEFTVDDFSTDHMIPPVYNLITGEIIPALNATREAYLKEVDPRRKKNIWYSIIQMLPDSYMQKRTLKFNYETAVNIIRQRNNHRLDEWHVFCNTLRRLPMIKELMEV